jgi:DNA-binding response OmpR family regulator
MQPYTLLIANAHEDQRAFLTAQLDGDGHTVHHADSAAGTIAKLSVHAVDVLILDELEQPADSPALLRAIRAEAHTRIHPAQPIITLGNDDELTALRAYEAGSDHHLPDSTGYLLLRAVLQAVARRAYEPITNRHINVGALHTDTAAKAADINATPVHLSRRELQILVTMATDPTRVFSRSELIHAVWGTTHLNVRTIETHLARLRHRLAAAGGTHYIQNAWGQGWSLTRRANAAA